MDHNNDNNPIYAETTTTNNDTFAVNDAPAKMPFYSQTWFVIVIMLFCCMPLGIFLMWKYEKFNKPTRYIVTTVLVLMYAVNIYMSYTAR